MSTIFRRLGGRIVPIKIGSEKIGRTASTVARKITAKIHGEKVGHLLMIAPESKKHVKLTGALVDPPFRSQGIASAMFEHAAKLFGRAGKKSIRTGGIEHAAQVSIREKYKSRFFAHGRGMLTDGSKRVTANKAREIVQFSPQSKTVTATTLIPKKFRRK
jgi:predicted GNAT family acetyltransferase